MHTNRPNFFIIGAAKAGTSSLYRYIAQHPEVFMSPVKEPHFFSYRERALFSKGPGDDDRVRDATPDVHSYLRLFKDVKGEKAIGEASTTYLDSLDAPGRIREFAPNAKIIVMLRNPVDRAYASFMHLRRDGVETCVAFEAALAQEETRIQHHWSPLWHYQTRQFTYEKLSRYYALFPPPHIRVYSYEAWRRNNAATLKDLFSFLEVADDYVPDLSTHYNVGGVPKNERWHRFLLGQSSVKSVLKPVVPPATRTFLKRRFLRANLQRTELPSKVRRELLSVYREDIMSVQQLTGMDLSHWFKCD
jgi:hypothetical protein